MTERPTEASSAAVAVASLERIVIEVDGRPASHLAVRLEQPPAGAAAGVAVLYLHGFGSRQSGTKAAFFRSRFLDLGLPVCTFDFQGHGESGGSLLDLSLSRNLEDVGRVHGWLAARGVERIVLMGSSMGGGSALWYAALHPESVAAAVLVAPSLDLAEGLLRRVGPAAAARWQREGKLLFQSELVDAELGWGLIEDLRSFRRERLTTIYRTPTLVFQGKNDTSVAWRTVLDFVVDCAYEEIELHLMADADHRMVDRLDHLWRSLRAFLVARRLVADGSAP